MANKIVANSAYGRRLEHTAGGAISPGMRIQLDSDGDYTAEATQGGLGQVEIATEDGLQGNEVTDAYADQDVVHSIIPLPGDDIRVLCLSGETVNKGTALIVNNAGKYIATTGTPAQTDFEAVENAGTLAADTLVLARKL